jgi:hypothetical protein
VMRLYNSKKISGNGLDRLAKGRIQLQSEGAEVFYRNIEIRSISEIPKEFVE